MEKTDDLRICSLDIPLSNWKAGDEIKDGTYHLTFNELTGIVRIKATSSDEHWIVPLHHVRYMGKK
jgi:hypothetical protein